MRGFELSEKYFVAEMEFESSSSGEEKRRSHEKSLQRSTNWDLKVAIKVGQNFKHDKSCFASAVRSSRAGFCAAKFIVDRTELK